MLVGDSLKVAAVALAGKTFGPGAGALSADCLQPMLLSVSLCQRFDEQKKTQNAPHRSHIYLIERICTLMEIWATIERK